MHRLCPRLRRGEHNDTINRNRLQGRHSTNRRRSRGFGSGTSMDGGALFVPNAKSDHNAEGKRSERKTRGKRA
jgi:hypothetical protein